MQPYRNLEGHAGVTSYEIGDDFIKAEFHDGIVYVYDYRNPGAQHVERMKELARSGKGLSTYISQNVRTAYARKEKAGAS